MIHILLKPGLEDFEHYFASVWDECNCVVVWTFFGIAFPWDWKENWSFPVLWPLLGFPNLVVYWVQHSQHHLLGFEIAPLEFHHLLALFVVMLPNTHLTLHFRMSASRWVITPSWFSRSWRHFLYSSSMCSCHLFLISSASVRSTLFLSFIVPIFAWNILLVSLIFLKRSLAFPILLFSSFSLHWSLSHLGVIIHFITV